MCVTQMQGRTICSASTEYCCSALGSLESQILFKAFSRTTVAVSRRVYSTYTWCIILARPLRLLNLTSRNRNPPSEWGRAQLTYGTFFLHMHLRFLAAVLLNIYMALRVRVKGMGLQKVFSSVLPVREIGLRRSGGILWVNNWLHG